MHMISKVLRWCKRQPVGLHFKKLPHKPYVLVVADSAYQAKPAADGNDECIALRGWFVFLACMETEEGHPGGCIQPVEWTAKKLQVVSRSAPAAELRNAVEAAQDGINFAMLYHEVYRGPVSAEECARIRDCG